MKLRCIQEARHEDGSKIMEFTKGNEYDYFSFIEGGDTFHFVKDDNGRYQNFFRIDIMFKRI